MPSGWQTPDKAAALMYSFLHKWLSSWFYHLANIKVRMTIKAELLLVIVSGSLIGRFKISLSKLSHLGYLFEHFTTNN